MWKLRVTYADKDPREIMKALRHGNRNYIDKFEELLDGMEAQMEVRNHSPSPKHLADKNFLEFVLPAEWYYGCGF